MKPPFSNQQELFIWGPIPLRNFYSSPMCLVVFTGKLLKKYGPKYHWPLAVVMYRDEKCAWVNNFNDLWKIGGNVFLDLMLTKKEAIRKEYNEKVALIQKEQQKINQTELQKVSDSDFLNQWETFFSVVVEMWSPGLLPEMANYGGEKLLKEQLEKEIKNSKDCEKAMQILTAPKELSFYQQEEIALAETSNLRTHAQKFGWIKNSYHGPQKLSLNFFAERQKNLSPQLRKQLEKHLQEVQQKKAKAQKQFSLSEETMQMAKTLAYCIAWQDQRKGIIFQYIAYMEKLLEEMIRRKSWNKDEMLTLDPFELADYFSGKTDYFKEAKKRRNGFTHLLSEKKVVLGEKETTFLWDYYLNVPGLPTAETLELKGIVVSTGKNPIVKGKVCILLDPHEISELQENDVLVAPMTSPEYIFAMKKAIAIVTDTGGLTSHAAIVSRELQKPCIVATRFATKKFQNGDWVEVNTLNGTIKKG